MDDKYDIIVALSKEIHQVLKRMGEIRKDFLRLDDIIYRAENVYLKMVPGDQMWERIKKETSDERSKLENEYSLLEEKFQLSLNKMNTLDRREWEYFLRAKGKMLCETSNIKSVGSNIYHSEEALTNAVMDTRRETIKIRHELSQAITSNSEEEKIMLKAQFDWYMNDLGTHHWGDSALAELSALGTELTAEEQNNEKIR